MAPFIVYKCWSRDGSLLYVGHTGNLSERKTKHSQNSPWWKLVVRVTTEPFQTRPLARRAERDAIKEGIPLYNYQHNDMAQA